MRIFGYALKETVRRNTLYLFAIPALASGGLAAREYMHRGVDPKMYLLLWAVAFVCCVMILGLIYVMAYEGYEIARDQANSVLKAATRRFAFIAKEWIKSNDGRIEREALDEMATVLYFESGYSFAQMQEMLKDLGKFVFVKGRDIFGNQKIMAFRVE